MSIEGSRVIVVVKDVSDIHLHAFIRGESLIATVIPLLYNVVPS